MGQQKQRNRRWVLASRPHGAPVPENLRLEEDDVATPGEGQVLLRTVYLSLDPYMRGRMSDEPSYSPPVDIGGVMVGGTVSRVVKSNHPDYQPGDWVLGYSGWQDYDISSGDDLVKTWRSSAKSIVVAGCAGDARLYRLYGAAGYRSA
ncbi:putative zinc-binding dehydrogenase [Escherichia coli]|nr:putative zinc-binding dehydrogenase [Escherichia coli]